jgi:hypothetical protein
MATDLVMPTLQPEVVDALACILIYISFACSGTIYMVDHSFYGIYSMRSNQWLGSFHRSQPQPVAGGQLAA